MALFSGLSRVSTVPAGNCANASLVGAKTVNGPLLLSVSTRPAALTAATRVVWSVEFIALETIVLVGDIDAPPTIGFSLIICAKAAELPIVRAAAAIMIAKYFFIPSLPLLLENCELLSDIRGVGKIGFSVC